MVEPVVVPRAQHTLSRREVDPDALKVLYRLHQNNHLAYLVGGSVRDLLLGRRPKDFDIGTDAHPYQVKRLFRNCWIIGRRFRLAHVKFGANTIEVATFRRQVGPGTESEPPLHHGHEAAEHAPDTGARLEAGHDATTRSHEAGDIDNDQLIHRDNTFGTPEEDAFRRDFTVNALFYDIAHFSIIDYVGGLDDLRHGLIRCIGNPDERFR
jgi:poly(A) polymerase